MPTTAPAAQLSITFAYNGRTSLYEVHMTGCRHLNAAHLEPVFTEQVDDAKDAPAMAAERYEARNEGCLTKLGPCARD